MTLKKLILFLLSLTLVLFFAACSDDSTEPEEKVNEFDLVTAVGDVYLTDYTTPDGSPVNVSIGSVFTLLTDGNTSNDPYILDYRGAADFATGHITGAVNIALGDLMDHLEDIPDGKMVLNVCYTGQNASVATAVLNMLGYDAQNLLYGMCSVTDNPNVISGTDKWKTQITGADEYTLNKDDAGAPPSRTGFPTLSTGKKTAEEIIMERFSTAASGWGKPFETDVLINKDNYFIVNYWSATDYATIGHIEGAYQFTPNLSLQKAEDLELLPTDQPIVIYCWTGQTSAQVAAYLRILGYDAYSLYNQL
jgi:rhodanese-related sulfurtransferase